VAFPVRRPPLKDLRYTQARRRQFVSDNLARYEAQKYSIRDIAYDVKLAFTRETMPSTKTIHEDLKFLRAPSPETAPDEYRALLALEAFPEWRARFFVDPATGQPYQTPRFQHAWFAVMAGLARKEPIPDWALDLLARYPNNIPDNINDLIAGRQHLISWINLTAPRHGKTALCDHGSVNLICGNRDMRILRCAGITGTSGESVNLIRDELEFNEGLTAAYGQFKEDTIKPWADGEFKVYGRTGRAKASTMLAIGKGTNVLSKDADLIVIDDPQSLDDAMSQAQTMRDYKWLTSQVMTRREPHTPVLGFGSYQPSPIGDLWWELKSHIADISEGRHVVILTELKAHDAERCQGGDDPEHTECILWPELRPYWFLEAQRAALGDADFESIFNQEPRHGQIMFFRHGVVRGEYPNIPQGPDGVTPDPVLGPESQVGVLDRNRTFGVLPECCGRPTLLAFGFDPAAGETKDASETALVALSGCARCRRRYLVEWWSGKQSPELHPGLIGRYAQTLKPLRVRIEINAFQKALARDPSLRAFATEIGFGIEEWLTDERKNDPMLGVPVLARWMEAGKLSVPYALTSDREHAEGFLRALIRWPRRPNDIPMALWLAELSVKGLIELANMSSSSRMRGWERLSPHLRQNVWKVNLSDKVDA